VWRWSSDMGRPLPPRQVPPGTMVLEKDTRALIGELKYDGDRLVAARGGDGGMGNAAMKPTRNQVAKVRFLFIFQ
jgi:GTPase involved in cell partitioning and DNA repair